MTQIVDFTKRSNGFENKLNSVKTTFIARFYPLGYKIYTVTFTIMSSWFHLFFPLKIDHGFNENV